MTRTRRLAGTLATLGLLLAGCREVLEDFPDTSVASMRMSADSMDLVIGTTTDLDAFPLDQTGALRPGREVAWSSSDPAIATVDDSGQVTGVSDGTVSVTATTAGVSGVSRVRVGAAPAIQLSRASVPLGTQAGQTSPSPETVAITNSGGLSLTGLTIGAITYAGGQSGWLQAALNTTTAPATLTLTPVTAGIFTAGSYTATVPITSSVASNSPLSISVPLTVAPGPPTARVMTIVAGDGQTAAVGSAVAVAPAVQVADTFGNLVAGLQVDFQVLSGGGGVTGASAITGASGVATVGSWTVGAAGGVPANGLYSNQLIATAAAATGVTFNGSAYYSYTTHVHPLWAANSCLGCHGVAGNLNLNGAAATVYSTELFNVATSCAFGVGVLQVAPGGGAAAEANSLLMIKLDSLPSLATSPCTSSMPPAGPLPAAVRDIVRAWIRAGAPLN
ncbi:MAG: Ig-like domain-containing protein [Gemmatimonadota bacterium]|nr:Ig-like domain-containing protein [Gemmatimonadota bacterium]MDH4348518.1 Ig-like domain-containing protein [Gemmatimonadota bacterium]MDH5283095.1 Ig-like domain-containing protein [Gemmatimonadota bacterium]